MASLYHERLVYRDCFHKAGEAGDRSGATKSIAWWDELHQLVEAKRTRTAERRGASYFDGTARDGGDCLLPAASACTCLFLYLLLPHSLKFPVTILFHPYHVPAVGTYRYSNLSTRLAKLRWSTFDPLPNQTASTHQSL